MTTLTFALPAAASGRRWGWGWGISLLVHAGLLGWLLQARPPLPPPVTETRIEFVLVPPRVTDTGAPLASAPDAVRERPAAAAPATPPRPARMARRAAPVVTPKPSTPAASAPDIAAIAVDTPSSTDTPTAAAPPMPAAEDAPGAAARDESSAPRFDIAAARRAARQGGRQDKNLVALPEHTPNVVLQREREEKAQQAMERARRGDCRTAYAGLSLLAVIPLVIDTVRDKGCKW
ncbi:hypothetical protein HH212_24510 [Massilia forsythiae]|uniref:Uncharacterized protein n=1 Tax=Massilia forsythiae TaxID=2728020 RepID=A0A7Z2W0D1_9BURK|nr:hypothetical protein [Massilia forsythiae]QJE02776.1 hypothetical protein HH212_24510 [Massilia forsythiae]